MISVASVSYFLGHGTSDDHLRPTLVKSVTNVQQISFGCESSSSLIITANGMSVY